MNNLTPAEYALWFTNVLFCATLAIKLSVLGLSRKYRFFWVLLVHQVASAAVLRLVIALPVENHDRVYAWTWAGMEVAGWLFSVLVVYELYSLVLQRYPGIEILGRWTLASALCVSMLLALSTMFPDLASATDSNYILRYLLVTERGLLSALVFLLLLIAAFVAWYPVLLPRNVLIQCFLFALYFIGRAFGLLVRNVSGHQLTRTVSMSLLATGCICLLGWIVFFRRSGEQEAVVIGHRWEPGEEDRLVGQLKSLNSVMMRAARK